MKILVTHPGRQHSHQAALALARAGALAGYWSGVPATATQFSRVPHALRGAIGRYRSIPIPDDLSRWTPLTPARRRLGDRLLPRALAAWNDFAACRAFDRWVARRVGPVAVDAVVACEISALDTFERIGRRGGLALLDAPSFHHLTQDRLTGIHESARLHERIARTKNREIELADHILTVSPLARESYLAAGAHPDRVHSLELGADFETFTPSEHPPQSEAVTFIFCGAMLQRKGFDVLLDAFRSVPAATGARLLLVGPRGDASEELRRGPQERIEILGALAQAQVAEAMRKADCLVLPSRHDSYGMVVAEAMACGLPAIVSETVGAKSLVREGVTGWVVPTGSRAALERRMSWCATHVTEVRRLRTACRLAAENATWDSYHRRFVALVERLIAGG